MSLVRALIVVLIAALAYTAYRNWTDQKARDQRQAAYVPGQDTDASMRAVVQMIDGLNAGITREQADEYARQVMADGRIDVEKLGKLLRPSAERAGQLTRLQQELQLLASGLSPEEARKRLTAPPPSSTSDAPRRGDAGSRPVEAIEPELPKQNLPPYVKEPKIPTSDPRIYEYPPIKCGAAWGPDLNPRLMAGWYKSDTVPSEDGSRRVLVWTPVTEQQCPGFRQFVPTNVQTVHGPPGD